jgi:hypothetical protein
MASDMVDDLHEHDFGELRGQVIDERANRRQQTLSIRDERGERGVTGKPIREDATQPPRSHLVAADVTRQGNDPETGYGRLLETNHVIAQEAGRKRHDHLVLAFA